MSLRFRPRRRAPGGGRTRWGVVAWLVLLLLIAVGGMLQERIALEPDGTTVLRRFLRGSGHEVGEAGRPPAPTTTFVLLRDDREGEEVAELEAWAEEGGRLVVADPGSLLVRNAGVEVEGELSLVGTTSVRPSCLTEETRGVDRLVVPAGSLELSAGPGAVRCFLSEEGALAVRIARGEGEVWILGAPGVLLDPFLERGDNALFALRLLDAGGPVVFGTADAAPTTDQRGVWELLPAPARVAVLFAALAGVLFGLVRGRRLGMPVLEEPASPIPGSELVEATAGLYRRARAAAFAAGLLRRATAERLARRLGIARDVPPDELPDAVASAARLDADRARRVLGGAEPANDDELIALGRELERILDDVEGASR